jgi:lysyl-tRNA synthetase, class I
MGVMVEGAGKDHSTKGGARDVANHISREVFKYEPPFDVPYEFFLVGGQKMSSSKGRGSSAREIADLVPAKILRLALIGKDISQQVNFDPEGDTIPVLYDQYDKLLEQYRTIKDDDYARLLEYVHPAEDQGDLGLGFVMRFSQVSFMAQMPHMKLEEEAAKLKGSALTEGERGELLERAAYAKRWLAAYAPEKYVFKLQDELPEVARNLSDKQKQALQALLRYYDISQDAPSGEDLHHRLHELKDEIGIEPKELFSALYRAFLGKESGPKAGWFLSVLPKEFVLARLAEAST